jgi:hypothetical protein
MTEKQHGDPLFDVDDAKAGSSDPSRRFREQEVSDEERESIEKARERRLADENRPDNAEVDNTKREFDSGQGKFVDDA